MIKAFWLDDSDRISEVVWKIHPAQSTSLIVQWKKNLVEMESLVGYAHPIFCRYLSSVTVMLGWWRPPHVLPLVEQCGSNALVATPTSPSTFTGAGWQQCFGGYAHPTFHPPSTHLLFLANLRGTVLWTSENCFCWTKDSNSGINSTGEVDSLNIKNCLR